MAEPALLVRVSRILLTEDCKTPSRFLAHPVTMPLSGSARKKSVPTSDQWPMVPRILSRKHENKLREKEMGKLA
jgi:hypothetical protein